MTGTGTQADPFIISNWPDLCTAVGTSGAYVEFPKQLVRTSDTTIQTGKLYVDSNGDAIANPKTSEISSYYENIFTIDFNDIAPYGYDSANPVSLTCVSINARGGAIKNLHLTGANSYDHCLFYYENYYDQPCTVSNLAMINVLSEDADVFLLRYDIWGNVFRGCHFSGKLKGKSTIVHFYKQNGTHLSAVSCGFNLELSDDANWCTKDHPHYSQIGRFEFIGATTATQLITGTGNYITGKLDSGSIAISSGEEASIYDIEVPSITGTNSNHTLANSDKCSSISSGITAATTAQLKDADWLRAQNFPIQS